VEHGGEADPDAEMLGVGGDGGERLRGGLEQKVVDGGLVTERNGADCGQQGEDDVVIRNRQQLGVAVFEPSPRGGCLALRAVTVPAGVVSTRSCAQSSQRSTWPPSAAVRQISIVDRQRGN
jgi:hypothetical protein